MIPIVTGMFPNITKVKTCLHSLADAKLSSVGVSLLMKQSDDLVAHLQGRQEYLRSFMFTGDIKWLQGLSAMPSVPALGPFIAAGPAMKTLASAGIGGSPSGIQGALKALGIPPPEAEFYEEAIFRNLIFLSVQSIDKTQVPAVAHIFEHSGGQSISGSLAHQQKMKEPPSTEGSL